MENHLLHGPQYHVQIICRFFPLGNCLVHTHYVSLVSWPLSPLSRFVNYNPKDGPSSSPKEGICVLYIYVSIYMYTNITKWFVEQTFDFLLGSYVDHIWHAHKAKSRISLVDTIDGKACCPINGMRGTSPHSPISWQTANVKNPCAIETCSYMYRIKRNIYIYILVYVRSMYTHNVKVEGQWLVFDIAHMGLPVSAVQAKIRSATVFTFS